MTTFTDWLNFTNALLQEAEQYKKKIAELELKIKGLEANETK